jgi:hypothetical protein
MSSHRRFDFILGAAVGLASLTIVSSYGFAQEFYQLKAAGLSQISVAIRQQEGLVIRDQAGQESYYRREARLDTNDGQWFGYYSRDAQQAILWPAVNVGPMQIGTLDRNQQWQFRSSRMSIQPQSGNANSNTFLKPSNAFPVHPRDADLVLPDSSNVLSSRQFPLPTDMNQAPIPIQLGLGDTNRRRYLSRVPGGGLSLMPQASLGSQAWYIVPLPNGLARVQYVDNGTVLALGCQNNSSPLDLYALADRADQLWRISPCPGHAGSYALESLQYPGQALTFQQNRLALAPIAYSPYQQWWPTTPIVPAVQPLYRSVSQNVIPNPPLAPANVVLRNTHNETLILLVSDIRNGGASQKLRIPRGGSEQIAMDRDSGATIVETFEVRSHYGDWDRREFRTPVPPAPIYDISVYEEFLQSIAIDATGTSPNPIEDINYQPRSVGLVLVPPGVALPDQVTLDPFRMAEAANNAGAVRRLNPKDYDQKMPASDPLRDILREFQGRRAAF